LVASQILLGSLLLMNQPVYGLTLLGPLDHIFFILPLIYADYLVKHHSGTPLLSSVHYSSH
jgi:hypothetical protein